MVDQFQRFRNALADRYRIERELGRGGMATVYLAEDLKHRRQVAIKVLDPALAEVIGAERFLREVEVTANLSHPHILPLHDSGEAEGLLYYVMPYVTGGNLRERLSREKQLPLEDAFNIARDVAEGLSYAHEKGVTHRDIKPENIMLESGHALIADFGLARAVRAGNAETLTGAGFAVGTPPYMSPEQAAGERDVDGRSDQYSLACVVYEMLAGQPPFTGPTPESVMQQHLVTKPSPVSQIRPAVPRFVSRALQRALAKSAADRFDPVTRFTDALGSGEKVAIAQGGAVRGLSRRSILLGIGVAAAVLAAVLLALTMARAPELPAERPMLAVLPFENLGSPEDEYFADGITEEITSRLSEISGLGVVSRTSALRYKGSAQNLRVIGADLGVQYVLEGTIRTDRILGEVGQVRVTPQLIRVSDDSHIWTDRYTANVAPEEIFDVQAAIAEQVALALDVTLLAAEASAVRQRPTTDSLAHDAYLQGRHQWNQRTAESLQRAAQLFADATARDPGYASAYAGLADAYVLFPAYQVRSLPRGEAYARAEQSARRALALDSVLANAHASLAFASMNGRWDWEAAEQEFQGALILDPDYAPAHYWYAQLLHIRGRFEEAMAHAVRAVELEPATPITHSILGWVLLSMDRVGEAEEALREALLLEPGLLHAHSALATIALMKSDWESYVWQATAWGMSPEIAHAVVDARRDPSRRAEAVALVGESLRVVSADASTAAMVYMLIGAADSALAWSERAVAERSELFATFIRLPILRESFADPRIQNIVQRMDLTP